MGRLHLDVANPYVNYNILENTLVQTFNKCIPVRKIKLHKHKHKRSEWITMGLIRSIKYRDNLYKRLKQMSQTSNEYYEMKQNLRVYNRILKRSKAKAVFYKNKFNQFKGDSKKTWSTINDIIKRSDSKQLLPDYLFINNEKVSDQDDIVNYFNNYWTIKLCYINLNIMEYKMFL